MTRQRLLARVAPVSQPLGARDFICARCGIPFSLQRPTRDRREQCTDCRHGPTGNTYEILQLADAGWTPEDIATELGMDPKYVRLIIRRNPA